MYNPFQTIGNGSVRELVLTLDPTRNYRFKLNAANKDGTSPWSNVVEWGALRMDAGVFLAPYKMAVAKYTEDAIAGVWIAQMVGATIDIRQYPPDWSGQTTEVPTGQLVLSEAFLNGVGIGTVDPLATLTLYQATTPAPQPKQFMVLKYQGTTDWPFFFLLSGSGSSISARRLVIPDGTVDGIIMEDGVLLRLYRVSETNAWQAVVPSSASLSLLAYNDIDAVDIGIPLVVYPYLLNRYPLALATAFVPTDWAHPFRLDISVAESPWEVGPGWVPTKHSIVLDDNIPYPDWNIVATSAKFGASLTTTFITSAGVTYGESGIVLATASPDASEAPPLFLLTDTAGWGGTFTIDEDLYVWGLSNSRVRQAPETPQTVPNGVVNIHRMRLDQNSGLAGYGDVGSNLMVFGEGGNLAAIETVPVTWIRGIGDTATTGFFNDSVSVLSDKSIVLRTVHPVVDTANVVDTNLLLSVDTYQLTVIVAYPQYTNTQVKIDGLTVATFGPGEYPGHYNFSGLDYPVGTYVLDVETTYGTKTFHFLGLQAAPPAESVAFPVDSQMGVAVSNGLVYITGGYTAGGPSAKMYEYSPLTQAIVEKAALPTGGTWDIKTATLGNGDIIMPGGYNGGHITTTLVYDPLLDSYLGAIPPRPSGFGEAYAVTTLADGKVAVTGGDAGGSSSLQNIDVFDYTNSSWYVGPLMTVGRQYHTSTLLNDGRLLIYGGMDNGQSDPNPAMNYDIYDPVAHTVTPVVVGYPVQTSRAPVFTMSDGKVLAFGGHADPSVSTNVVTVINPGVGVTYANLPFVFSGYCAVKLVGKDIVILVSNTVVTPGSDVYAFDYPSMQCSKIGTLLHARTGLGVMCTVPGNAVSLIGGGTNLPIETFMLG